MKAAEDGEQSAAGIQAFGRESRRRRRGVAGGGGVVGRAAGLRNSPRMVPRSSPSVSSSAASSGAGRCALEGLRRRFGSRSSPLMPVASGGAGRGREVRRQRTNGTDPRSSKGPRRHTGLDGLPDFGADHPNSVTQIGQSSRAPFKCGEPRSDASKFFSPGMWTSRGWSSVVYR